MKTFHDFLIEKNIEKIAEQLVDLGIDSQKFCEVMLQECQMCENFHLQENPFAKAWGWVKKQFHPDITSDIDTNPKYYPSTTPSWTQRGRNLAAGVRGNLGFVKDVIQGNTPGGWAGSMERRKNVSTVNGAINDLKAFINNLYSNEKLVDEIKNHYPDILTFTDNLHNALIGLAKDFQSMEDYNGGPKYNSMPSRNKQQQTTANNAANTTAPANNTTTVNANPTSAANPTSTTQPVDPTFGSGSAIVGPNHSIPVPTQPKKPANKPAANPTSTTQPFDPTYGSGSITV